MDESSSIFLKQRRSGKLTRSPLRSHAGSDHELMTGSDGRAHEKTEKTFNDSVWLFVLVFFLFVLSAAIYFDRMLPEPRSPANVPKDQLDVVPMESNVRDWLDELVAHGIRISGSHTTEVIAVEFFLRNLKSLKSSASAAHDIDIDVQRPSGCFPINFMDLTTSCYRKVTNIVARLRPKKELKGRKHSFMLNCHFDSAIASPGANDDAISCAMQLEILRILSRSPVPLAHDVVFLFNGAEENFLQAAHGFITQHPWRHSVRSFMNLEAAGAGGREILFQAGPGNPWLMEMYIKNAPHPFTSVIAQEVFQAKLIPSDTDFRILRDFGAISGLDIAYNKNGYVYHTEFDLVKFIDPGSIQRALENILGVTTAISNSNYLSNPGAFENKQERMVFFDFLGLFAVHYPHWVGHIINLGAVFLLLFRLYQALNASQTDINEDFTLVNLLTVLCICLTSLVGSAVFIFGIAKALTLADLTMAWYSRLYLLVFLYILPGYAVALAIIRWLDSRFVTVTSTQWLHIQLYVDSLSLIVAAFVLLLTAYDLGSAYYLTIFLVSLLIQSFLLKYQSSKYSVLFFGLICHFVPLLLSCAYFMVALGTFAPIMGRSGSKLNPEYFIGVFCISMVWTFIICSSYILQISRNHYTFIKRLAIFCAVSFILITFGGYTAPFNYNPEAPTLRRVLMQHVNRRKYDIGGKLTYQDYGFFFAPTDFRGPKDLVSLFASREPVCALEKCITRDKFCGLPPYYTFVHQHYKNTIWMKSKTQPPVTKKLAIKLQHKLISNNLVNISITLTGPDHITAFLTPNPPCKLVKWSLTDNLHYKRQQTQILYLAEGQDVGPWRFWFQFEVSTNAAMDQPIFTLTAASQILHGPENISPELQEIVNDFRTERTNPKSSNSWKVVPLPWVSEVEIKDF